MSWLKNSFTDVPFATVLLTQSIVGFVNGVILILVFDVYHGNKELMGGYPLTLFDWFIILSIGILTYIGPASLTIGLQIEAAGLLSLMRKAFAVIFAYTFQITIFKVSQKLRMDYQLSSASKSI